MTLDDARTLAAGLMAQHALQGWSFRFDGARRRLGCCRPGRREISLSRHFVRLNGEEVVRDVLLHEIAHALTPGAGHGPAFKAVARSLGCTAASCVPRGEVVGPPPRYLLECPHCGERWPRYRRPSAALVCGRCRRRLGRAAEALRVEAQPG